MKLSIIIPAYGVEKYIAKCLNSILKNNQTNYEILVINDCSTDNTLNIAQEIAAKNSHIHVLTPPYNLGLPGARNFGLKHAKGEYIAFLDGDDFIAHDYIENIFDVIERENSDIIRLNYYLYRSPKRLKLNKLITLNQNLSGIEYYQAEMKNYRENIQNMSWQYVVKKQYLDLYNIVFLEHPRIFEDITFLPKLLYHAKKVSVINSPLIYYRLNPNSIMNNKTKILSSAKALFEISKQLRELANEYDKLNEELRKYANIVLFFAFKHGFRARDFKFLNSLQIYHQNLLPTYRKSEQVLKINFKNLYIICLLASIREGIRYHYKNNINVDLKND